jgi:uncharacterized membrane protein
VVTGPARRPDAYERLTLFSDAVVAIALTLLAVELPVPNAESEHVFFASLHANLGHYVAFIVSFAVVAVAWRNHNRMNFLVVEVDSTFELLTFGWLLTVVLLPFAAKLLTVRRDPPLLIHAYTFGFYALLEVVSSAVLIVILHDARAKGHIESSRANEASQLQRRLFGFVTGFGLSIPLFFVTNYAWALWFLGPTIDAFVIRTASGRNRPKASQGQSESP